MAGPNRIGPSACRSALAAVCLISASASLAAGQVIRGRVVDRARGAPIPATSVILSNTSGDVVASARTNEGGEFEVQTRGAGVYRLAFKRIGFQDRDLVLEVGTEAVVRVPEDVSSLEALAVELETATVIGEHDRKLERTGFYDRRQEGHGAFITREEFEITNPRHTTDVLRRMRGIRVKANGNYGCRPPGECDARRYIVETSRVAGSGCLPLVFLDGVFLGSAQDKQMDVDMTIPLEDIQAIEVYSGMGTLPAKFNIMGGLCGAILIWTQ